MPRDDGVPGRGAKGVDVNVGARPGGSQDNPAVRGAPLLAPQSKEVFPKVLGGLIVVEEIMGTKAIPESRVKDVQRGVVVCPQRVLDIILEFHVHAVAIIILPTLEPVLAILLNQFLQRGRGRGG